MGRRLRQRQFRALHVGHSHLLGDGGSMLLEVLIGFSLFAVVVLATGSGTLFTTVAASAAQQRSVAYTLVSADIANLTALPFADVTAGLNRTVDSLAADPNIQAVGA